jgi:hypothetical protein
MTAENDAIRILDTHRTMAISKLGILGAGSKCGLDEWSELGVRRID